MFLGLARAGWSAKEMIIIVIVLRHFCSIAYHIVFILIDYLDAFYHFAAMLACIKGFGLPLW